MTVAQHTPTRYEERRCQPANFARRVLTIDDHFGSSLGDREQITAQFADGTPGRVFDLDDDVVVYNILPGTDLTAP
jgi:hypothetical protein